MSARLTSLVVLVGLVVGGLVLQTAISEDPEPIGVVVDAGIALPAARQDPTLSSTWYCAGGSAVEGGIADHSVIVFNPTDTVREATITALPGVVAPAPAVPDAGGETTTTEAPATTTARPEPVSDVFDVPSYSRVVVPLSQLVQAELVGALVEVDGGRVSVEHEVNGGLGRATAPCSTTASTTWSFPWGVTERGSRELLVFMNPFPDDATVDVSFATDEGVRDTQRFIGFVVPGRSVVGAYIDEDVTRKAQVSAQVQVRSGRVVVDRIQTFDGTDGRRGITLGLGAPTAALTWMFPDGLTGENLREQIVVFNPGDGIAEVEVEVRLDDPEANGTPEPFEVTVPPSRYTLVDLHAEDRIPHGVAHSSIVRSLNGEPVVAERAVAALEGAERRGIAATLGAPLGATTWYFPGGGTSDERDEFLTLLNLSNEEIVLLSVLSPSNGQVIPIADLQDLAIEPGGRLSIRLGEKIEREDLPLLVRADGPIVVERGLYRAGGGQGLSQAIGIPLADDTVLVLDPIDG